MITNSRLIDMNAVSIVEVASRLINKGKDSHNFFTQPYIDKLYSYAEYVKDDSKARWKRKIDLTFDSINKRPKEEVITILDCLECSGDIMEAISEGMSDQELRNLIRSFGLSGERLVLVSGILLEYSDYGIKFHDQYSTINKEVECDMLNQLYEFEKNKQKIRRFRIVNKK